MHGALVEPAEMRQLNLVALLTNRLFVPLVKRIPPLNLSKKSASDVLKMRLFKTVKCVDCVCGNAVIEYAGMRFFELVKS